MKRSAQIARLVASPRVPLALTLVMALTVPGVSEVVITHDGVDCVVVGAFPVIQASLQPPDEVTRARVYFRGSGGPHWYYVDMESGGGAAFKGVLPRPLDSLEALDYYIETLAPGFVQGRSGEFSARVIGGSESCPVGTRTALTMGSVPSALLVGAPEGAPALPAGFSSLSVVSSAVGAGGGGLPTGVVIGIGAAAGAAGIAVAVGGGGGDGGTDGGTGSTPGGPPEPTPTPTPAPNVTGRWVGSFVEEASATQCSVTSDLDVDLQQSGANVTGSFQFLVRSATPAPGDPCPVDEGDLFPGLLSGTLNGDIITLGLQITGGPFFTLQGTVSEDRMGGSAPPDSEGPGGSWELVRQ